MVEKRVLSKDSLTETLLSGTYTTNTTEDTDQRSMEDFEYQAAGRRPKNIFYTDKIIKFFVCVFYGIIPSLFTDQKTKWCSFSLPLVVVILHWYSVFGYVYCAEVFWIRSKGSSNAGIQNITKNVTDPSKIAELPQIPVETLLLLLGLAVSGAITVTMAVIYFYATKNDFNGKKKGNFKLLPKIALNTAADAEEIEEIYDLPEKEWLIANILLMVGMLNVVFVLASDFGTDTLFNFHGIRAFLATTTPSNQAIYILAVAVLFWGFGGTVCACCIFHIMSRNIIVFIKHTQKSIIDTAMCRDDFFRMHERLLVYTEKMINKFKYWFAIHNSMFVLLVAAMIFEWITFMRNSKYAHKYILSQVAGTMLICYKFAFPLFSASRVTVRFKKMYMEIFRRNQIKDTPELLSLQGHFGFTLFGLQITPSMAILVFFSSFLGILKFLSSEMYT